ncbi:MAG: hypothetical protein M3R07_04775, partial [Gemmatimonadota bacterium]|nr:hypothetical protein [Gemmatimonadota bacterium]
MTVGRSGSLRRRRHRVSRTNGAARSFALRALAALLFSMIPPLATQAEEGGEAIPIGDFRLLEPVENMLSAGSWVM